MKKNIFLNPNAYTNWIPNQNINELTRVEIFTFLLNWLHRNIQWVFLILKLSFWAYFNFTKGSNINEDKTKDWYNKIITRIKFDNNLENITLTQG